MKTAAVRAMTVAAMMVGVCLPMAGCATKEMKGTPFFTGEYSVRQGPAEDRVNLWPVMYYRKPALSVLWPLIELTEDHFAFRPVTSVYGLDEDKKVFNVLWPLSQFDGKSGENRIFPFFWGRDYLTAFPLYWHHDQPFGEKGGYDGLIPLWSYYRHESDYSAYFFWPLIHLKNSRGEKGWHVWPLAGNYTDSDGFYRFGLWPLGHQWSSGRGRKNGDMFLPLYYREWEKNRWKFFSLPWSFGYDADERSNWQLAFPLFYHSADPRGSRFLSLPYSQGVSRPKDSTGYHQWSLLFPLYFSGKDGMAEGKQAWHSRLWASLAGGYRRDKTGMDWVFVPLLAKGNTQGDSGSWYVGGPLAHAEWDAKSRRSHLFPFYYRASDPKSSVFLSLPWSCGTEENLRRWQLVPPLFYHSSSASGRSLLTPLYSYSESEAGKTRWDLLAPLYFSRKSGEEHLLATLLGGYRSDGQGKNWLIYPLLSGGRRTESGGDVWVAAPLIHAAWDKESVSHQFLPFYYWNSKSRTFLSPLAATWSGADGSDVTAVPPFLSLYSSGKGKKEKTLWTAGGLARFSWGEEPGPNYFFPLYYKGRGERAFISPLYAGWSDAGRRCRLFPPVLSGYAVDGKETDMLAVGGLFHHRWGGPVGSGRGYLFPLYFYEEGRSFLTPLFGWNKDKRDGYVYPLTPLVGFRTGERTGGWLFPLFDARRNRATGRVDGQFLWGEYWIQGDCASSGIFPFYSYHNKGSLDSPQDRGITYHPCGKEILTFPGFWYENTMKRQPGKDSPNRVTYTRKHGLFPLWSYSGIRTEPTGEEDVEGRFLLLLYDYKREVTPVPKNGGTSSDYRRARVLWRLWHYERIGDTVSVDVFPTITYDRKGDTYRKTSFLWRFFRYERDEKGRKLDLLFVPILRSKSARDGNGAPSGNPEKPTG